MSNVDKVRVGGTDYNMAASGANVGFDNTGTGLNSTNVQGAIVEVNSSLSDEVETRAALGAHNLLPVRISGGTSNGITYTVDKGVITLNSDSAITTATDILITVRYGATGEKVFLPNGEYFASGGVSSQVQCVAFSTQNGAYSRYGADTGDGFLFTVNGDSSSADGAYVGFLISVGVGGALSNVKVKPMITLAKDKSAIFAPYAMTNRELTEKTSELTERSTYKTVVISVGTASTTYKDHFTALKTAYNTLTDDEKLRSEIWQNTNGSALIFRLFSKGAPVFTSMVVGGSGQVIYYVARMDDVDNNLRKITINANGTITNESFATQACSQSMYLVVK